MNDIEVRLTQLVKIERRQAAFKEEKKLARIEDAFVAKKAAGNATRNDRQKLRRARQDFRDNHRKPKTGAQPAAIGATAAPEET